MTYDRYYYSILPQSDKQIYKAIYEGIQNFETSITVPKSSVSLQSIFQYIGLDNPHIFYVDFNQYTYFSSSSNAVIKPIYWYTKQDVAEIDKKVQTVLQKMLSRVKGKTDYEKEKSVHDLLIENVVYDTVAVQNIDKYHSRSNSILGVLFFKTAVCEGIAKVTKMLLNLLDIKCIVATGSADGEAHAWNIVKIDNEPYHLDVTWDINLSTKDSFRYDYFNLTDKEIFVDHTPNTKYPPCLSNKNNYFCKNKLVAKNVLDIERIITTNKFRRKKDVTFKYVGENFEKDVKSAIGTVGSVRVFSAFSRVSYSINNEQKVCTIKL